MLWEILLWFQAKDTICWEAYTYTFTIAFLYNKPIAMKNTSSADYVRKYLEEVWILFEIVIAYYISKPVYCLLSARQLFRRWNSYGQQFSSFHGQLPQTKNYYHSGE